MNAPFLYDINNVYGLSYVFSIQNKRGFLNNLQRSLDCQTQQLMLQNICQMYILEDLDMILFETLFILLNNLLLISFYLMGFYSSKANIRTLLIVPINLVHIFFSYSYSRRYVLKHISDFYSLLPQGLRVFPAWKILYHVDS